MFVSGLIFVFCGIAHADITEGLVAHYKLDGNAAEIQELYGGTTDTHIITATAGTGGTISPSGAVTVNDGADQTFTIQASSGYQISDVKVNDESKGSISTYTFTSVTTDHTILATFALQTYSIPVMLVHGYGGSPSETWGDMGTLLEQAGFDVYYADYSSAPLNWTIQRLASVLSIQIAQILSQTGASSIDIVAYSMGGLVTRAYMTGMIVASGREYGGEIRRFIMIATPNHGSAWALWSPFAEIMGWSVTQAEQMQFGSDFIWKVNTAWNGLALTDQQKLNMLTIAGNKATFPLGTHGDDDYVVNISSVGLSGVEQLYVPYVHIDYFLGTPIARVEDKDEDHKTFRIVKQFLADGTVLSQSQIGYNPPSFKEGMLLARLYDENDQPITIPNDVSDIFDWPGTEITKEHINRAAGSQTDQDIDQGEYNVTVLGKEIGYYDVAIDVDIYTAKTTLKKVSFNTAHVEPFGDCDGKPRCYSTIQEAINAASNNRSILIAEGTFNEHLSLSGSKDLTLSGGWNASFTSQSSTTTVNSLTITDGTIIVDNLVIQ